MERFMKYLLMLCGLLMLQAASGQTTSDNSTLMMASKYYEAREYSKAAPLFRELHNTSGNIYYFRTYIQCLTEMQAFEQAENELKKEIRRTKNQFPELHIQYGYILQLQKRSEEAREHYEEAIRLTPSNRNAILNTASYFMQWREFENAEKVLVKGQKTLPSENFSLDLAQVYLLLRNHSRMMEELLEAVKMAEESLPRVQSMLSSALYLDIDNGLRDEFRKSLIKRIQAEPSVTGYNRLLIWFYLQEKQFPAALRQAIALDRRTGKESPQIIAFAQMAFNNNSFEEASAAYDYILSKGRNNPYFHQASFNKIQSDYLQFTRNDPGNRNKAVQLATAFEENLGILGYSVITLPLIMANAHLLSFYLNESSKAIAVLEKGLKIPGLKPEDWGILKTELADVYINTGDPWEATLLYSQVIDANRENTLGDDVKLKKAKLGYYMGNFSWAKAQLDVLKASTSKLTANDAMELSLFITNNSAQDSTQAALTFFARADLLFFRNQDSLALVTLDSIQSVYTFDLLIDDILFRKAKIEVRRNNHARAISFLEEIVKNFSWDLLADDALFMMGEIWQYQLNDRAKAAEAYKQILFDYSGSIYISEARKRYRELSGSLQEQSGIPEKQENQLSHDTSRTGY